MLQTRQIGAVFASLLVVLAVAPSRAGEIRVDYVHQLSDFTGTIPVNAAALAVDRDHGETYMVYQNVVRIFNDAGMEIFQFGDPESGLLILDVAIGDDDIFALVRDFHTDATDDRTLVEHRDYRGDLQATHRISGLPSALPELQPEKIFFRDGRLLLVDKAQLLVIETDLTGQTVKVHDIRQILALAPTGDGSTYIFGFDVSPRGEFLITIPTEFKAYVIDRDGAVRSFGKGGSVSGTFGVVAGITADAQGRIYVSDRLRSVVMVFDADLRFVTEFGYRGRRPENLINPGELAIDDAGRLYVTQRRNRGVAVFKVTDTDRTDPESVQSSLNRKEVGGQSAGVSHGFSLARTDSGSGTSRSHEIRNTNVGLIEEPLDNGFDTLGRRALPGRR